MSALNKYAVAPWPAGTTCPEQGYAEFAAALNKASHHFADDSGKEWGQAGDCMKKAVEIAINARWPYWAMQRMYREIAPLPTFDHFMGDYCATALTAFREGSAS